MPMPPATPLSQPGIFNVLDPWYNLPGTMTYVPMVANDITAAATNSRVLRAIINIAQTTNCSTRHPYGATILFPGHSGVPTQGTNGNDSGAVYYLEAISDTPGLFAAIVIQCNWPLRFLGTGNAELAMLADGDGNLGDMFSIQTASPTIGTNDGGLTFEDLTLSYPPVSGLQQYAAIHTIPGTAGQGHGGAQNVRLVRVVLEDCPIGAWFEEALQPSLLQCTIEYGTNIGVGVMLGNGTSSGDSAAAHQVYIAGCVFEAGDAPTGGSTAIYILGCEHARVSDCQIDGFTYGILIKPGPNGHPVVRCSFTNVTIYAYTSLPPGGFMGSAVIIQPQSSLQQVGQIVFTSCFFEPSELSAPTTATGSQPPVLVDATSGIIDTVRFVSCYSTRWPGPGLSIQGGAQNIEVLGGMYAGNNYSGFTPAQPWGIYVGKSANVRIVGVSCIGKFNWLTLSHQPQPSPHQQVGIYVDGGAADVLIDACDLTNNNVDGVVVNGASTAVTNVFIRNCDITTYSMYSTAISVLGARTNSATLEVTNCSGYNDKGVPVAILFPSGTAVFGTAFFPYQLGVTAYYGPIEFYIGPTGGVTGVMMDGRATALKTGSFYINPGETTEIDGGGPINFLAVGK